MYFEFNIFPFSDRQNLYPTSDENETIEEGTQEKTAAVAVQSLSSAPALPPNTFTQLAGPITPLVHAPINPVKPSSQSQPFDLSEKEVHQSVKKRKKGKEKEKPKTRKRSKKTFKLHRSDADQKIRKWKEKDSALMVKKIEKHGLNYKTLTKLKKTFDKKYPCKTKHTLAEIYLHYLLHSTQVDKSPWNREEKMKLIEAVRKYGKKWTFISCKIFGARRPPKQCREFWERLSANSCLPNNNPSNPSLPSDPYSLYPIPPRDGRLNDAQLAEFGKKLWIHIPLSTNDSESLDNPSQLSDPSSFYPVPDLDAELEAQLAEFERELGVDLSELVTIVPESPDNPNQSSESSFYPTPSYDAELDDAQIAELEQRLGVDFSQLITIPESLDNQSQSSEPSFYPAPSYDAELGDAQLAEFEQRLAVDFSELATIVPESHSQPLDSSEKETYQGSKRKEGADEEKAETIKQADLIQDSDEKQDKGPITLFKLRSRDANLILKPRRWDNADYALMKKKIDKKGLTEETLNELKKSFDQKYPQKREHNLVEIYQSYLLHFTPKDTSPWKSDEREKLYSAIGKYGTKWTFISCKIFGARRSPINCQSHYRI